MLWCDHGLQRLWPCRGGHDHSRLLPRLHEWRGEGKGYQGNGKILVGKAEAQEAIVTAAGKVREDSRAVETAGGRATGPRPWALPSPKPPSTFAVLKRFVLGDPLSTSRLKEERLGRAAGLAVFASDMLSSVAYATEEMLRVLVPVIGLAAFGYVMPLHFLLAALLIVLLVSYRQVIKEYPTAGGAYMVTRDNFGILPAQVAGYALLTDYIMTAAVSSAAGVLALTSYFPGLHPYRVYIAVGFVFLISWGNLRGVRESARMFAFPAYLFLITVGSMIVIGVFKFLTGNLHQIDSYPEATSLTGESGAAAAVGIFLLLKAFASGGAAATGIEAVSNGVSAFKPPEWKYARDTLTIIVTLVVTIFLGIGFLASVMRPVPDPEEKVSVLATIAREVFGGSAPGKAMFGLVQLATMLVLIFAANTSFTGFPRLASFEASDMFLPKIFTKRGYRLNFSTGIIFLACAAAALLIVFQASVTRLIPLYAVGVFTSITLCQAGMTRHHLHRREEGWKKGVVINGLGAAVCSVVAVIIGVTKFSHGAWAVILVAPFFIVWTVRVNRHYRLEQAASAASREDFVGEVPRRHVVVVLAERIDGKLIRALEFAQTLGPERVVCIHLSGEVESSHAFVEEWNSVGPEVGLQALVCREGEVAEASRYVRSIAADSDTMVTVVVPAPFRPSWLSRLWRGPLGYRISRALRKVQNVNVCVVRELPGAIPETTYSGDRFRFRISPRPSYRAVVAVEKIDQALVRAIKYARAIRPFELECVHVAVDPEYAAGLVDQWIRLEIPEPLEVVSCEDRDIGRAVFNYLSAKAWNPRQAVLLILPRRDFPKRWHFVLHDRTRRKIARAISALRNVYVVSVPYFLGLNGEEGGSTSSGSAVAVPGPEPLGPAAA